MPEDDKQWNVSKEDHETYLWRLGNLALLSGPINISISNKPFDQKKSGYQSSKIEPNKDIAQYNSWDANTIIDRQKRLVAYALAIWSV